MKSTIIVIFLFMSYSTHSEIDITTLDNFGIFSTSEHNLIISKQGNKDRNSFLAYRMERPFCVCSNPVISLPSGTEELEVGSELEATIQVDLKKGVDTLLRVLQIFDSGHLLLRPLQFPTFRSSSLVKVKTEYGISETFSTKGIDEAMKQSRRMCESEFLYEYVEPKAKEMRV
tara:strand:+ start:121 stop:639 length:519 start_codon:yes stop_codon:yes gene_type:complete